MVQITFLMVAAIMAITPVAQAGGCTPGLTYCGRTLLEYGYDDAKILEAARAAGMPVQYTYLSLYTCHSGGVIEYKQPCGDSCVDGGGGSDDYCT
ncbi:hypothetical protein E4U27_008202 [Claviceps purpurea]|nr:hypothetical protein E4U27_008202 [Claviceps purpurea]